jgi:hypothetical protein
LANVETLLNLAYIVPLLNVMKNLIKLAQAWDVFVIDLVQTLNTCRITWNVLGSFYCFQIRFICIFLIYCEGYSCNNFDEMDYRP